MFKYAPIFILLSIYLSTPLWSDDKSSQQASINTLIQEIKKAPNAQKRVKMNELKILLRTMNQETRNEAMRNLQKSFSKNHPQKNNSSIKNTNNNGLQQGQHMQIQRQGQHQGKGKR